VPSVGEARVGKEKKVEAAVSSEAEENKALVRRFFEARVKTDLDAVDQMLAPDFVSHTKLLPGQQPDREGYKRTIAEYAATFANRR
jgi:ketosteroid isomerase-like protein